jgi:hypothetical protein
MLRRTPNREILPVAVMKEHDEISSRDEKADDKAHLEVAIKKQLALSFVHWKFFFL